MSDVLERATRALKDAHDESARASSDDAARTRDQVLARAELGRRERRVTRAILLPIAASFILVASWAAASGALRHVFSLGAPEPSEAPSDGVGTRHGNPPALGVAASVREPIAPPSEPSPPEAVTTNAEPPGSEPVPRVAPVPPAAPRSASPRIAAPAAPPIRTEVAPSNTPASTPPITDVLYADAHRAHFEAHDWARALAAWDAYLADAPDGRFAPEARYNRALCLIRLGRRAEAEIALRPIADARGYRSAEAAELLSAIDAGR